MVQLLKASRKSISFIGFGEAGQAFASGFSEEFVAKELRAFDIKTDGPDASEKWNDYESLSVAGANSYGDVCKQADAIFSLVTADQASLAAQFAARTNLDNALYFDCNSCSPDTKRRAAAEIENAGGRYVDVAIMTPVHPKRHKSPCLISGPHVAAAQDLMAELSMNVRTIGAEVGAASARKMIRSVMVKGLEALTLECFLAARKYGIERETMTSLEESYPGFGWPKRAPYMFERAITHGKRRAAEMNEVEKTLREVGIEPHMTAGTYACQHQVGAMGLNAVEIGADKLSALSDAILERLGEE